MVLLSAGALSAGTYAGGWRITRTLGRRIIDLDPPRGFAAPISTTQTITSSILNILIAWVLTIPMAALAAALTFWAVHGVLG